MCILPQTAGIQPERGSAMRRILAVGLSAGVLLVWWFCQYLSVKAQGGQAAAIQNGDVNGDDKRDIADAVFLLTWMFEGGPEPVPLACADPVDLEARVSALEEWRASQEFGREIAGIYLAKIEVRGTTVKGFLTFTPDGGFMLASQFQFHPGGYRTIMQGRWTRTGEEGITGDAYWMGFDENREFPGPNGGEMGRLRWEWTLVDGFNELSGETVERGSWGPGQDLLVDVPFACQPVFTMTARRIDLDMPPKNCQ